MYRSPFTILPLPPNAVFTRSDLQLERRKILAEFELQGTDSILLNGHELHRQDVVSLFDQLKDERSLAFHLAVWSAPDLLRFLETGLFQQDYNWAAEPFAELADLLSPYFALAQNHYLKALLDGSAPIGSYYIYLHQPYLVLADDEEQAYRSVDRKSVV